MSETLAPYAVKDKLSRGRRFSEKPHRYRNPFERDRDRIIHSTAFRRLEGKTQVFTPGLNDHYRTRLTHTIEVAQIGRTIAKELNLNINLTEGICLAHDLGHAPFGHSGEAVLDEIMKRIGGFEHNNQTLRVVELLEHPYPDFAGLNLMYETRLGLDKHRSTYDNPTKTGFKESNCSCEGQVADIADRIAYNCHDLEDGMLAGLIEPAGKIELFSQAQAQVDVAKITDPAIASTRTAKAVIDILVSDCIETSKKKLKKIKTLKQVYGQQDNLIALSDENDAKLAELEKFLMEGFYLHESVTHFTNKTKTQLLQLFNALLRKPEVMPEYFQSLIEKQGTERTACDYIAGMTDRFCLQCLREFDVLK